MSTEAGPSVSVKLVDGLQFMATDQSGHTVVMDVSRQGGGGGSGFTPGGLLLAAIGGCTGMDVAIVLSRKRQPFRGLHVMVTGEKTAGYPAYYERIHIKYVVIGEGVKEEAVKDAIRLSQDTYCSVAITVSGKANVTTSYELVSA